MNGSMDRCHPKANSQSNLLHLSYSLVLIDICDIKKKKNPQISSLLGATKISNYSHILTFWLISSHLEPFILDILPAALTDHTVISLKVALCIRSIELLEDTERSIIHC